MQRLALGVRGILFLISMVLIVVVGTPAAVYLEVQMRTWMESRLQTELVNHARMASTWLTQDLSRTPLAETDAVADRLGALSGTRMTLIDAEGRVRGDSLVPLADLETLAELPAPPEVQDALQMRRGIARRHSDALGYEMLFVAVPYPGPGGGVVRTAVMLDDIDIIIDRLRLIVGAAALVTVLMTLLMTLFSSHLIARPVRNLLTRARPLLHDERSIPPPDPTTLDGAVGGSVPTLARELDRTLAALAGERDRFETVLKGMKEGVLALDAADRLTLSNPAAHALLGIDGSAMGDPLTAVVRVPELLELCAGDPQNAKTAEFSVGEAPGRRVRARVSGRFGAGDRVVVLHDVTEMRRLETVRKDFVANVSHELRTPVSIVRANAETLLDGGLADPDRARVFVEAIHRHAERLSHLIADLLDLSRLEAGRYRFHIGPISALDAAHTALEAVRSRADSREVQLEVDATGRMEVMADTKAVDQILFNLLDNAIKHAPQGGRVWLRVEDHGSVAKFVVEDNGAGISDDQRERIFERFYRVDMGRSRDRGGTGLGLAIVKHLTESMEGHVGVEDRAPSGARFWFTLPVVPQDPRSTRRTGPSQASFTPTM